MAVFISPRILISFVKLMTFGFLVPFTNDVCLSMAALLLAVNNELLIGYNAGNFTKNDTLLISAGTAQYIIFVAICAIELIFAKMLIWDDVKSISSFNPGQGAVGLAATGTAIIGAGIKLGSMALGGGKAVLAAGGMAAKASVAATNAGRAAGSGSSIGDAGLASKLNVSQAVTSSSGLVSKGNAGGQASSKQKDTDKKYDFSMLAKGPSTKSPPTSDS
jgi:hypothetical protein